jgi:hypothetical protein
MYAIVAITHFFGPSVSAPKILDNGFETAKEAWAALKSEDRSETMSHNQYNTTYYVIDEKDIPECDVEIARDGGMPDSEEDRVACDFHYRRVADAKGLNAYLDENYPYDDNAPTVVKDSEEVDFSELASVTADGYPLHHDPAEIKKFLYVCGDGECGYCHPHYLLDIARTIEKKAVRKLVVGIT